jgi:hypothetical protein
MITSADTGMTGARFATVTNGDRARCRIVTPTAVAPNRLAGFTAAVAVNALIAVAFWVAVTSRYGFSDGNDIGMNYEQWVRPTTLFLAVTVVAGLFFLVLRGWRWFGVGLITGAVTAGLLDLAWTLIYFVGQGS